MTFSLLHPKWEQTALPVKTCDQVRRGGWIGVDLDGTLAHYDGWISSEHIGPPIQVMVERVQHWIAEGQEVRIFTARVTTSSNPLRRRDVVKIRKMIEDWCEFHIGHRLKVTNVKDFGLRELWDDRAVRVAENTGQPCCNYKKETKC